MPPEALHQISWIWRSRIYVVERLRRYSRGMQILNGARAFLGKFNSSHFCDFFWFLPCKWLFFCNILSMLLAHSNWDMQLFIFLIHESLCIYIRSPDGTHILARAVHMIFFKYIAVFHQKFSILLVFPLIFKNSIPSNNVILYLLIFRYIWKQTKMLVLLGRSWHPDG